MGETGARTQEPGCAAERGAEGLEAPGPPFPQLWGGGGLSTGSRASALAVRWPLPGSPDPPPSIPQLSPGLLLLAWLPACLARHSLQLRAGAPRCYSAEELSLGHAPPHLLARAAKWEQALPVALVSSLEAAGRRKRQAGSPGGIQCQVLQPEEVLEADIHQRSISPWRYR